MPIVVEVKSDKDYQTWLDGKKADAEKIKALTSKDWTFEELMAEGKKVYNKVCAACHMPNGQGMPPLFPALKGAAITTSKDRLVDHVDIIVNGVKGSAMQAFAAQLSEVEIAAVTTYERNAWGNDTGEMVTPKQVLEFKNTGTFKTESPQAGQ